MKNYFRFIKLIVPHSGVFAVAVICMIMATIFSASPLVLIIPLVDIIITGKQIIPPASIEAIPVLASVVQWFNSLPPLKLLNTLVILVVVFFLLKGLFDFLQTYFMNDVSQRVIRDVKNRIYRKLQDLSMDFYNRNPTGQLMSCITYDAAIIRDAISSGLADTFYQPIQLVVYVGMIIATVYLGIPLKLILISFVLFPLILYPVIKIGKRLRKISSSSQEKIGDINNMLLETIAGAKLVKAFCMQDYEWKRFKEHNQTFYRLSMKSVKRMKIVSPLTELIGTICAAVVLFVAGEGIVSGELSAGVFIAFIAAVFSMMKPVKKLSSVYGTNQHALAAADRIFKLLDEPVTIREKPGAACLMSFEQKIVFKNIFFHYNKGETILTDINLTVNKGDIVALVGPSGGGKSTLVNLIPRFYDPSRGDICIDELNLKDISIKSLREKIGFVTQETLLFNDSVKANITYGHKTADEDQLLRVAEAANAHRFIKDFPEGYDTVIGERGLKISGGQRQRIAIARAIYKNPPVLIFDEATSQLDTESERLVQDAINNLMKGRTVIVIAHRLSTVKNADKIVVIDKGRIVDSGSHEELLGRSPLYKKLYEMQFSSSAG